MTAFTLGQIESFVNNAFQGAGISQAQLNAISNVLADSSSRPGETFANLMNESSAVGEGQITD